MQKGFKIGTSFSRNFFAHLELCNGSEWGDDNVLDVLTFGELLIDFVPEQIGVELGHVTAFKKAPGGAPANVAVAVARLGGRAAFAGKVGDDAFGHYLAGVLADEKVDVTHLLYSGEAPTALAFVSLKADGERDFLFYRNPSADMLISRDEISDEALASASIFHFGSLSLGYPVSRDATHDAAIRAAKTGALVSFDVNWRPPLWPSQGMARQEILAALPLCQLLKVSEEELAMLTGATEELRGAHQLMRHGPSLVLVTRGAKGALWVTREEHGEVAAFPAVSVDTTGAGDGFMGGVLVTISSALDSACSPIDRVTADTSLIRHAVRRGNAVGALTVTRSGAIPALPTVAEVDRLLSYSVE